MICYTSLLLRICDTLVLLPLCSCIYCSYILYNIYTATTYNYLLFNIDDSSKSTHSVIIRNYLSNLQFLNTSILPDWNATPTSIHVNCSVQNGLVAIPLARIPNYYSDGV